AADRRHEELLPERDLAVLLGVVVARRLRIAAVAAEAMTEDEVPDEHEAERGEHRRAERRAPVGPQPLTGRHAAEVPRGSREHGNAGHEDEDCDDLGERSGIGARVARARALALCLREPPEEVPSDDARAGG